MAKKIKTDEYMKSNMDIIYDILGGVGVESFIVTFDGGGDSGQIDGISEFKPNKCMKSAGDLLQEIVDGARINDGTRYGPSGPEQMWKENPTLTQMIEGVCYDILESVAGGWEINEGSYGTFHFDVKKRKMNLDFNERVVESNLTEYTL